MAALAASQDSITHVTELLGLNLMKPRLSRLCLAVCLTTPVLSIFAAKAVTFTNDTTIAFGNSNYENAEIVVSNCTLTVDGTHAFAGISVRDGGVLTHSFAESGLLRDLVSVTSDPHWLTGTNAEPLVHSNVVAFTVLVTDDSGLIIYSEEADYHLDSLPNGLVTIQRTADSTIPDGGLVVVDYFVLNPPVPTGLNLDVAGDLTVEPGGTINADGKGYGSGFGSGDGQETGTPSSGGGGGYGGFGGMSSSNAPGGTVYGSTTEPMEKGSSGGTGTGGVGGNGGGAIRITVGGQLRVDGSISADGVNATNTRSGGGSGGSVWLSAGTFAGSGSVSANGGKGEPIHGGGGGGGRIAIYTSTNCYVGTLKAWGGRGFVAGGAGTIYFQTNGQPAGLLILDNGGQSGTNTLVQLTGTTDMRVQGGAVVGRSRVLQIRNLLIASNSWIVGSSCCWSLYLTVTGNATIETGAGIIADGIGSLPGMGAGHGWTAVNNGTPIGSGAGHGGYGGEGTTGAFGGDSYGSFNAPSEPGSGGGFGGNRNSTSAGAGGGTIRLMVGGALRVDGILSVTGNSGGFDNGGGGSGGSIWVTAGSVTGAGRISANGGSGLGLGGGGGGGRIAVYCQTNQFSGTISAMGGAGASPGGAGTVYIAGTGRDAFETLLVDNGGQTGASTTLGSYGSFSGDLVLRGGAALLDSPPASIRQIRSLVIGSNAWVRLSNSPSSMPRGFGLTVSNNATIHAGGGIIADGAGFDSGHGPGAGEFISSQTGGSGGGGGYGGMGASGTSGDSGGSAYGSLPTPNLPGSGGGGDGESNAGGSGGGLLRLEVLGTLQVDGVLSANGTAGSGTNSGGGSGGSVWISAGTLSGNGTISANGGEGTATGGGGGGGRIAMNYDTNMFSGALSAYGAAGFATGGAGTIYLKANNRPDGLVLVDNGTRVGTNTSIGSSPGTNFDLTLTGGASVADVTALSQIGNLIIGSNAWIVITNSATLNIAGDATIEQGGRIIADGLGYPGGQGQGSGRNSYPSNLGSGGGGYGGMGAPTGDQTGKYYGGRAYGSLTNPTDLGSGGGAYPSLVAGGAGGGAIRLNVAGALQLNGTISANGIDGATDGSGGGSGGSVWVSARELSGAGTLSANGGMGKGTGGGGGGGRIAVYCFTNQFAGSIRAFGGGGERTGGAGTIYLRHLNQTLADEVWVDNGGQEGAESPLDRMMANPDLTVRGAAIAAVSSSSLALHNLLIGSNSWIAVSNLFGIAIQVGGTANIQKGGGITGDSGGYPAGQGRGAGSSSSSSLYGDTGGGGGHAGFGGDSGGGAAGGNAYGASSGQGFSPGSGGGGMYNSGGAGGARVGLSSPWLQLDGQISVNGGNALAGNAGGGSGGAVQLFVGTLTGTGLISANGGNGGGMGGGGGGGRIDIEYRTNQFTGSIHAWGGLGGVDGSGNGGAGTVYLATNDRQPFGQLIVNNGGVLGTNTPVDHQHQYNLTIEDGAVVNPSDSYLILSNLTISTDSLLTILPGQTNLDVTVLGDALVANDGAIEVDGEGFALSNGPGAGQGVDGFGSGAGYGGIGGASSTALGGTNYGSAEQPSDLGSAGGFGSGPFFGGSEGGGAIRLAVAGNLTVNGRISANGDPGWQDNSGGGSGGSVWITARDIKGDGSISAEGGAGDPYGGGGGGGGRIALFALTNNFTGATSVTGGDGFLPGFDGSVYLSDDPPALAVVEMSPSGIVSNEVRYLDLTFNQPVNSASFSSQDLNITAPDGALIGSNLYFYLYPSRGLMIVLPYLTQVGVYTVSVGPAIDDLFGRPMARTYSNSFTILLPVIQGRITDNNGLPMSGVTLLPGGGFSPATTDSNGNYSLGFVPGPSFTVTPFKTNVVFEPHSITYDAPTTTFSNQNYVAVGALTPSLYADLSATNLLLNWHGFEGVTYQLFSSTNLVDWAPYNAPIFGSNAALKITLPKDGTPIRFFRVQASN